MRWDPETEAGFQKKVREDSTRSYRRIVGVAIPFFLVFGVFDWISNPPGVREQTLFLRMAAVVGLFLVYLQAGRPVPPPWVPYALFGVIAATVNLMAWIAGGPSTPYHYGVGIIVLAISQLFPWGPKRIAGVSALVAGSFWVVMFAHAGFKFVDRARWIDITAYLFATSAIATWGAWISDRVRRESHAWFLEAVHSTRRMDEAARALEMERIERDALGRALAVRDEFISLASHELNTPLTALGLQSALLGLEVAKTSDSTSGSFPALEKYLARNAQLLKRMERQIEAMLEVSRCTSNTLGLQRERMDLGDSIRAVAARLSPSLAKGHVELRLELATDCVGNWDRARLEQIITHLIDNAMKYAPRSVLEIRLENDNGRASLEIADRGPGIRPEVKEKIFDRYERGGVNPSLGGIGLGLYVSRQLIEAHGGRIWVEDNPKGGAKFRIELPFHLATPIEELPSTAKCLKYYAEPTDESFGPLYPKD